MSRTLTLVLNLAVLNYCALSYQRGHQIPIVDDGEKWEKHGSIVIYSSEDLVSTDVENLLIHAYNHVDKYKIKLKKVNCNLRRDLNKKCKLLGKEPLIYVYKHGEEKLLTQAELNGTDRAINEILFFVASANYENLVYCSTMSKAQEIIDMSRKVFNVITGAFQKLNGEHLRHFLEAAMELGKEYSFVIVDIKSIDRKKLNKYGYFVEFHYALVAEPHEKVESINISNYANTNTKELINVIKTLEVSKDLQKTMGKIVSRKKKQDDEIKELKELELKKIEKLRRGESESDDNKSSKAKIPERPKPVKYPSVPTPGEAIKKKHEDNEIAQDSFLVRENKMLRLNKNQLKVTEHELKKYLRNIEIKPGSLLLILFYVPWDPAYEMFEESYALLAKEYKKENQINLVQLDCSAWPTPCLQNQIHSYPSIIVCRNGIEKPFLYKGMLQKEELKHHITLWKDDFLPVVNEKRQLEEIANQMSDMFLMGVFTEKTDSHILSVFKEIAFEFYGKVRIGALKLKENNTSSSLIFQQTPLEVPSLISLNANQVQSRIKIFTEFVPEKLKAWIEEQRKHEVEELTHLNLPRILAIKKPILISFRNQDRDRSLLAKLAKRSDNVTTVWMNIEHEIAQKIHHSYNLQQKETLILFKKDSNQIFEYSDVKRTISSISYWIHQCLNDLERNTATHTLPAMSWKGGEGIDFSHLINRNDWVKKTEDIHSDIIDDEDINLSDSSLKGIKNTNKNPTSAESNDRLVESSSRLSIFHRAPKTNILVDLNEEEDANDEENINDVFRYYDEL